MNLTRLAASLFAALMLLSACGFQLRGAVQLPDHLSPVHVQAPRGSRIAHNLKKKLRNNEIAVSESLDEAGLRILILEESEDERVIAVNSQGKVISKELRYRVRFEAIDSAGGQTLEPQAINLSRDFVNPELEVIGKDEEGRLIRNDMVTDMADRILQRIKARLRNPE